MEINFEKAVKAGVEQAMRECELTIGMTLKEAVERQVAKKPNPDKKFYGFGFCPTCNACFMDTQPIIAEIVVKNWIGNNQ